jgi:hypothetical protein
MVRVMHPFGFLIFLNERLPNYCQEFIRLNWLLQESSAASIEYTFFGCSPITPGQDDYRNRREIEVCFQYIQDNETIPVRYAEIQDDQVRPMFACFTNGSGSLRCAMNIIATRLEPCLEGLPNVGIVIDDQNVRLTHLGTYTVTVLGKLERERNKTPTRLFGILKAHFIAGKLYLDRCSR